MVSTPS